MVSLPIVKTATLERPRTSPSQTAFLIWVALNVADALITWYSFGLGASEANPLLSSFQQAQGAGPMLLLKVALAALVGALVRRWGKRHVLRAMVWGMLIVVVYNLAVAGYLLG